MVMDGTGRAAVAGGGQAGFAGLDLAGLTRAVWRRRLWIAVPTALALAGAFFSVNATAPTYRSEARIIVESGENAYTRPDMDRAASADRSAVDPEAVASQVQVLLSRDVAKAVAARLDLSRRPEFDPALRGFNPVKRALILLGLSEDPLRMTAEERVLRSYFDKVKAYQVDKSRVIAIQFESNDPALASEAANAIAAQFIEAQQANKLSQTRNASQWLSGEVDTLRRKVEEAEGRVESFRARANLFVGSNNTSLTAQQLAEVNSQIAAARAQQLDAQTRSRMLRDFLRSNRPLEMGDVLNSEIIRRLTEQRAAVLAQLAEQSSTLGPRHPRIAELRAQRANLEGQIRSEAEKLVRTLENDARFTGARVEALQQNLDQVKRQASEASEQEVQLRVLEREAKAMRDQLESLLARYRDATARETLTDMPADARLVSRAVVSNIPAFPKKLPTIFIVTIGTLVLSLACVVALALLAGADDPSSQRASAGAVPASALADIPDAPEEPQVVAAPSIVAEDEGAGMGMGMGMGTGELSAEPTPDSIVDLVRLLDADGDAGSCRRTLVAATAEGLAATGVVLALGRQRAGTGRRVVMVDLDAGGAVLSALAGAGAAGLAEFAAGTAGFGSVIHPDPHSASHLVPAGAGPAPFETVAFALDALSRQYDDIVILAGVLPEDAAERDALCGLADNAVVVAEYPAGHPLVEQAYARLVGAGLRPVVVMLAMEGAEAAAA